jgi:hypothetical protein
MPMKSANPDRDNRRQKSRFPIQRELRYRLMQDGRTLEAGFGRTLNIGSGGVAFALERVLSAGSFVELSVSWPVLLDSETPMRLVIFGRVLRSGDGVSACTVDKYEFRTQARTPQITPSLRGDVLPPRWIDRMMKQQPKFSAVPSLR